MMMEDQEMSLKSAVDKLDNNVRLVSLSKLRKNGGKWPQQYVCNGKAIISRYTYSFFQFG